MCLSGMLFVWFPYLYLRIVNIPSVYLHPLKTNVQLNSWNFVGFPFPMWFSLLIIYVIDLIMMMLQLMINDDGDIA